MNKQRRKDLQRAIDLLTEAEQIVAAAAEEEQEYFDNMPEGIQESERGERAQEAMYELDQLAQEIPEFVERIETTME